MAAQAASPRTGRETARGASATTSGERDSEAGEIVPVSIKIKNIVLDAGQNHVHALVPDDALEKVEVAGPFLVQRLGVEAVAPARAERVRVAIDADDSNRPLLHAQGLDDALAYDGPYAGDQCGWCFHCALLDIQRPECMRMAAVPDHCQSLAHRDFRQYANGGECAGRSGIEDFPEGLLPGRDFHAPA